MGRKEGGSLLHQFIKSEGIFEYEGGGSVSTQTQKIYRTELRYAAKFFKGEGIRSKEDIGVEGVQRYVDVLVDKGYTASTIHTKLAPICKALGVNMAKIEKPVRVTADYIKGTRSSSKDGGKAGEFNAMAGLRRHDLLRLRGNDFVERDGKYYVRVDRSKGGKEVFQRILPEYVEAVRGYFNGSSEKVFAKSDIKDKFDYHGQRRDIAQAAYDYYAARCKTPEGRLEVYKEIADYWHRHNRNGHRDKLEPRSFFDRPYKLRGATRELAIREGRPIELDRLALRAVSIMHLAHWRDDVTVASYMCKRGK